MTGILAIGYARYGSEDAIQTNAIQHLYHVYVAVNADVTKELEQSKVSATDTQAKDFFRRMEEGMYHTYIIQAALPRTDTVTR